MCNKTGNDNHRIMLVGIPKATPLIQILSAARKFGEVIRIERMLHANQVPLSYGNRVHANAALDFFAASQLRIVYCTDNGENRRINQTIYAKPSNATSNKIILGVQLPVKASIQEDTQAQYVAVNALCSYSVNAIKLMQWKQSYYAIVITFASDKSPINMHLPYITTSRDRQ